MLAKMGNDCHVSWYQLTGAAASPEVISSQQQQKTRRSTWDVGEQKQDFAFKL